MPNAFLSLPAYWSYVITSDGVATITRHPDLDGARWAANTAKVYGNVKVVGYTTRECYRADVEAAVRHKGAKKIHYTPTKE